MSKYRIGPNYMQRLNVITEENDLSLRTPISIPGLYWAYILSALLSLPLSFAMAYFHLYHEPEDSIFVLQVTSTIFGTMIVGMAVYLLIGHLLRRHIVLDRNSNQLLIQNRVVSRLSDMDHIEKVKGLLMWCHLAFVLKNGRKIVFLKHPDSHSSADTVAETLSSFLHVPFKDYGQGDYYEILQLRAEGDRLTMNPPNQRLARWITTVATVLMAAGAIYFAIVIFERQTGHPMQGTKGLGYIVFGLAACINYLSNRIFHRRIVLDKNQNRLTVGLRQVCALTEIVHIGLHMEQKEKYSYLLALVLTEGRTVPIITYDSRPSTTVEVANTLAHFLHVTIVDYHDQAVVQRLVRERQAGITS